jgi:hypothetical protein
MNNAMIMNAREALTKVLADPDFTAKLTADILAKRAALTAFRESVTFRSMLSAFIGQPEACSIDSEEVAYFVDRVQKMAGWEFATKEDIDNFFRVVADPQADSAEKDSLSEDKECAFDNVDFRNHGLTVRMLFGQGTFICISNR